VLVDPLTTSSSNRFAPTVEEMNRLIARIGLSIAFFRLHSVFAASMADDFCQLPPSIRAFHLLQSTRDANGVVSPIAISGTMVAEPVWNPLMVLAGFVMGLPRGVSVPTAFTMSIQADSTNEIWVRRFPGNFFHMRSTLWLKPSKAIKGFDVAESFFRGAVELQFRMKAVDPASLPFGADHPVKSSSSNHAVAGKVLHYNLIGAEVLGVPLPPFLCPVVEAVEYVTTEDGMESPGLRFDVMAKAPFGLGLLCHYRGSVTVQ
jgi:hypothetical protein